MKPGEGARKKGEKERERERLSNYSQLFNNLYITF